MNKEFFMKNRERLGEKLENNSMIILFAGEAPYKSADETYNFTPNRNFYYMTGINRSKMILMMIKRNNKVTETLYIEKNDPVMAKWVGEKMSEETARELSGVENISFIEEFEDFAGLMLGRTEIDKVYLDLERQEFDIPATKSQRFAKAVVERFPYVTIKNIYHEICKLRLVKTSEEVELVKKAIDITYEGIKAMWKNAEPGMMEYEIEANFDYTLKKNGVTDFAFHTIAASGKNATVLHYGDNNCETKDGDLMLLDLGAQYKYYNADISRTFPVNGKFTERQKAVYNVVLKANEEVTKNIKPGVPFSRLNEIAKEVLAEGCKELGLIKEDKELSKYYYHGVSHYLGLDTHDVGSRDVVLEEGMLLTNEPGLYIEEEAIGIRIEDDILVTKDGYENLSAHVIKSVEDIEKFMAEGK